MVWYFSTILNLISGAAGVANCTNKINLNLMLQTTLFRHVGWDISWVQPILDREIECLAQGDNTVSPVRLEPATP